MDEKMLQRRAKIHSFNAIQISDQAIMQTNAAGTNEDAARDSASDSKTVKDKDEQAYALLNN